MDAEIFREMFPTEYMNRFLSNKIRVDGRQFAQPRQISIEFTEGITNYQYADCFISVKHVLKETDAKEIDLSQCIRFQITFDNQDDLNNQEKARIERFFINHIQDIVQQILDPQRLRNQNNKVENIEFTIRVAGSDGSLLAHLINCVYFALSQIKINQSPIISREIKVQSFGVIENTILVDPSQFEEQNTSIATIVSFLDDGQYQLKKSDGKALNYIQIHQIMSQF